MKDLIDIFLQPTPVLRRLQEKPTWLLPLILLCATSMIGTFLYFSAVDAGWFLERSILQSNPDISEAQLKAIRESNSDGGFLRWSATLGAAVGLLIVFFAYGGYFWFAGKLTSLSVSYKQGLALATWSSMPTLINSILIIVGVIGMDPQTPLESLSITTLDPLLIQLDDDSPWKTFANSFTFLAFWTIWLGAVGWNSWSGAERWVTPVIVAAAPSVGIFSFMIIKALLA
ncbi:MAG: YIP1 family protein [Steroidobacteraceae bacterium]